MNGDAETRPRTDRRASATRAGRYVVWSAADHTVSRRVWQTAPAPGRHDVGPAQERVETGRDAGMSRLSGIALLDSLSEEELAEFERQCRWQRHRKGDQIVERAGENRDVYFIVQGTVEIVNHSISGRAVAYADLCAGHFFGELAALDNEPRSASVVARTDCLLASITPAEFVALLRHHSSEEHTSELQSLMRISYAVFCLKQKTNTKPNTLYHSA